MKQACPMKIVVPYKFLYVMKQACPIKCLYVMKQACPITCVFVMKQACPITLLCWVENFICHEASLSYSCLCHESSLSYICLWVTVLCYEASLSYKNTLYVMKQACRILFWLCLNVYMPWSKPDLLKFALAYGIY